MDTVSHLLEAFRRYIDLGGFVMPPLIVGTMILWYCIGERLFTLRHGSLTPLRVRVRRWQEGRTAEPVDIIDRAARHAVRAADRNPKFVTEALHDALFPYYQELKRGRTAIRGVVAIAPLLGLLGTVVGMIETFDSLGDMSLFAQSGGIAGGISQALFSTQMGLCVAVPGVIVGRMLERRQTVLEDQLDQLKALLGGEK